MAEWFAAWAGWAQFVGTIVAVWFAARFAHLDRLKDRVANMEALHGAFIVASDLAKESVEAAFRHPRPPLVGFPKRRFQDVDKLLEAIPVFELGSTKAAAAILRMRHVLDAIESVTREALPSTQPLSQAKKDALRDLRLEALQLTLQVESWLKGRQARAKKFWRP